MVHPLTEDIHLLGVVIHLLGVDGLTVGHPVVSLEVARVPFETLVVGVPVQFRLHGRWHMFTK